MDKQEQKRLEKELLNKQIEKFLQKGGKIQQCPEGAITEEGQLNYKFRRNSKSPSKKNENKKT
tara:strand:- start:236 stop:424 length:189 start_codon:yes stop_codon:yes gene_type:complete